MKHKRKNNSLMLMLLLALMPAAASAQYNDTAPSGYSGTDTGMSYEDMVSSGKTYKGKARQSYQEKLTGKRHIERMDRGTMKTVFVPKGMWLTGAIFNYREWENDNQNLLVLKDLDMDGHSFSVSPAIGYFVANNVAIGLRYNYSRNYFYLGNMDLNLGDDLNISLEDLYYLEHKHSGSFFLRTYMPLFGSKIMGFFNEVRATYSHANGKNSTGRRDEDRDINTLDGTYEKVNTIQLGFTPGVCAFVTDFAAVEASVGVFGVDYKWAKYKNLHPGATEYEYGKSHSGGANFKFNFFSINIGMTFYL